MDFQAPKANQDVDAGKLRKLAQRVEKTLNEEVLYKDPKQLDPRSGLMAPLTTTCLTVALKLDNTSSILSVSPPIARYLS